MSACANAVTGSGLSGYLRLVVGPDDLGNSGVREQSVRAPMHLSKPHLDGDTLIINAVNPTAGLFSGDSVECAVRVRSGGRAIFTSPSATRIHRATGGPVEFLQNYRVEAGSWLEVNPEFMIPQAGARMVQRTHLEVEEGGGLFFVESLAPGRVASGEVFAFEELKWITDLYVGDTLCLRERYRLFGGSGAVRGLRALHRASYFGVCVVVLPAEFDGGRLVAAAADWSGVVAGASSLGKGAWIVKVLAPDSIALRAALGEARRVCYEIVERTAPGFRRY